MAEVNLAEFTNLSIQDVFGGGRGFSDWLASEDGLARLGEALDMELELESRETLMAERVRADILCTNLNDDSLVVIETQLGESDYDHLGKLLTYSVGRKAVSLVWILETLQDEHRATLDWLNENTSQNMRFFGVVLSLGRADNARPLLRFELSAKPNGWVKSSRSIGMLVREGEMTPSERRNFEYWSEFVECPQLPEDFKKTPTKYSYIYFTAGRTGFLFEVALKASLRVAVSLHIHAKAGIAKQYFKLLEVQKDAIEQQFGKKLNWRELPDRRESQIVLYQDADYKMANQANWQEQHAWLAETLGKFDAVFRKRIRDLPKAEFILKAGNAEVENLIR